MYIIFYKTTDVFAAEEKFQDKHIDIEIVPTPVRDKAYCGVCLKVLIDMGIDLELIIGDMDYKVIK